MISPMPGSTYQGDGHLVDAHTISLDRDLPVDAGRARVMVETRGGVARRSTAAILAKIWGGQRERQHQPRSAAEVAEAIEAERESR